MGLPKFIILEGKTYRWRDILRLRREQAREDRQPKQQVLFVLHDDSRPASQRTPEGRYTEPTLFKVD